MNEPTIICPSCKTEIKLTESLAAPLIESTHQQFEQQLAQKDSDIAQREQGFAPFNIIKNQIVRRKNASFETHY